MTTKFALVTLLTFVGAAFLTCSEAPLVVQGAVIQYNSADKILVVRDEQSPNQELTIQLSSADIGVEPKPGDMVRISYRQTPQGMAGIRVMNLTHQMK